MGTYAITGSASGMGRETVQRLHGDGHTVIGVDVKDADIIADLSTPHGRREAADAVLAAAGGRLDGAVLAAGLGPSPGRDRVRQIAQVNYLGVVEPLAAWRPALAAAERAKVVVVASNSTTTVPAVPGRAVRALLDHDADKAVRAVRFYGPGAPTMMYAASKIAVSRWVRRHAVLLAELHGERWGLTDRRKHMAWYFKGFPIGGDLRRAFATVSSLAELDENIAQLDPTATYPEHELGTPRGRQGTPRAHVTLPYGWLDSRELGDEDLSAAESDVSGG